MNRRPLDEEALRRALRALAEAEGQVAAPARLEAAVMARWDAANRARGRSTTRRFVRTAGAMAAGVTLVGAVAIERELAGDPVTLPQRPAVSFATPTAAPVNETRESDAVESTSARRRAESTVEESRSALVLVGQPIADGEVVHVVRMRVTRASLRVFGVSGPSPAEMVDIDVVVGEDGVARGVRLPL
jgi:hypothetical protein